MSKRGLKVHRRLFLSALAAAAIRPSRPAAAPLGLKAAAREAWLFGLPLIEIARVRAKALDGGGSPNKIVHARELATHTSRSVTTPNNDTLYSNAWLDLTQGPVAITLPKTDERYFSVALMDAYSNNVAVLGARTTGGDGGRFVVVGPDAATSEPLAIRSPTPWLWMLGRTLVDGKADLSAARAIQDELTVSGPAGSKPAATASRNARWDEYFRALQALMNESPPRPTDTGLLRRISALGLQIGGTFDPDRFPAPAAAEIEAGVADAKVVLRGGMGQGLRHDNWVYSKINIGDFGQDYLYRAQVALGGLGALPRAEAMYMLAVNDDGRPALDSARTWKLSFPANAPPAVGAFWSLSMYEITGEGQFFFSENPIGRYTIGDRTPGLRRGPGGSLDIWMTRTDPGGERTASWLPSPAVRPFSLVFRGYLPKPAMIEGEYRLPAVRMAG